MILRAYHIAYITFDDPNILAVASEDPVGFVDRLPERVILDKVQRIPCSLPGIISFDG
jgi:hypothetical protein